MILPLERLREIAERRSPSLRWGEAEKIAAELLANREAQPVAVPEYLTYLKDPIISNVLADDDNSPMANAARILAREVKFWRSQPLFTAPPAPAYPERLPCPVRLMPGLLFGKGVPTRSMLEALMRREEFEIEIDAMAPEQRAEQDAALKALLSHLTPPGQECSKCSGRGTFHDIGACGTVECERNLSPVPDERHAFESFVVQQFGETVDRRRAKNGDNEYMAWDMAMAWIVWQRRAAMLDGALIGEGTSEHVSQGYKLVPVEPTPKQWAAGVKAMDTGMDKVTLVYKAMLATAPTQGEKQ